jgi:hypothetical protein
MAWSKVTIKTGDGEWVAQKSSTASNPVFSVAFSAAIGAGDSFTADGKTYTCINSTDFAQRGETLLVEAKESKNGKQASRGAGDKSSKRNIQDPTDD